MKNYAIFLVGIICFGAGIAVSNMTTENSHLKEENGSLKNVTKDTVEATINAGVVGQQVDDKIALSDSQAAKAVSEMKDRLDKWQPPVVQTQIKVINNENCPTPEPPVYAGPDSLMPLDIGSVRLLNAIRAGTPVDSVVLTDEESGTPAVITVRYFINSDSEIARMYNALAIRHNALVGEVEKYQAAQQKRRQK